MGKPKKCKHHGVKDPMKQREEREQKYFHYYCAINAVKFTNVYVLQTFRA